MREGDIQEVAEHRMGEVMPVVVREVSWLSGNEASLTISDGIHSCIVFAHPYGGAIGEELKEPLIGFNTENVVVAEGAETMLRSIDGDFAYEVVGEVIDRSTPLIRVGAILVEPDLGLPGDVVEGQVVQFRVKRLDYMG